MGSASNVAWRRPAGADLPGRPTAPTDRAERPRRPTAPTARPSAAPTARLPRAQWDPMGSPWGPILIKGASRGVLRTPGPPHY